MSTLMTPLANSLPATVPFVGPETAERAMGRAFAARIGANESVFGPSPRAIAAMAAAAAEVWKYGDPEVHELRSALAAHLGVQPANITVGEGVDGLLGLCVRLFVEPGVTVASSLGAYPTFNFHVAGFGGRLVTTPYVNDHEDPESLLALAKREGARVLYFANPDNPMGSHWPAAKIQALIEAVPENMLLVLDEAYLECAPAGTAPPIDTSRPNVLRFRTFSKAYGMAGLRVGYVIGAEPVVRAFDKVRNHFGVGRIAQAGALAALADQPWLQKVVAQIEASRQRLYALATAEGLRALPSATNFVAIDCGRDGAFAKRVMDGVIARGVFIRKPAAPVLDRCIRVSCGSEREMDLFAAALHDSLKEARS